MFFPFVWSVWEEFNVSFFLLENLSMVIGSIDPLSIQLFSRWPHAMALCASSRDSCFRSDNDPHEVETFYFTKESPFWWERAGNGKLGIVEDSVDIYTIYRNHLAIAAMTISTEGLFTEIVQGCSWISQLVFLDNCYVPSSRSAELEFSTWKSKLFSVLIRELSLWTIGKGS